MLHHIRAFVLLVLLGIVCSPRLVAADAAAPSSYQQGMKAVQAAQSLERNKQYPEALAAYQDFVKNYPNHEQAPTTLMTISRLARDAKQYDVALDACEQALKAYPRWEQLPLVMQEKSTVLGQQGKAAEAAETLKKLVADFPGYANAEMALWNVVDIYARAKMYKEALAAADAYLTNDLTLGCRRYAILRRKLEYAGQLNDAALQDATLADIIKLPGETPLLGDSYQFMATCADSQGKPDKAVEYLTKAIEVPSFNAQQALLNLAFRLNTTQKYPESLAEFQHYLARYPKGAGAVSCYVAMANIYRERLNKLPEAMATEEELLKQFPKAIETPAWMLRLAADYGLAKQPDKMCEMLQRIYTNFDGAPSAVEALWQHAEYLHAQKQADTANALYQKLVANYPNTRVGDMAIGRLQAK